MLLVIVAHPDDESLWFGGTLLRLAENGVESCIVSVTNAPNEPRAREFTSAAQQLRARPLMMGYGDHALTPLPYFGDRLTELLAQNGISHEKISVVITHSPSGNESHHPHHAQCFNHVRKWAEAVRLPLGFFSECPVQEIVFQSRTRTSPAGVVAKVKCNELLHLVEFARALMSPARKGMRARLAALRHAWSERRIHSRFKALLVVHIDLRARQSLLEHYASQVSDLRLNPQFYNDREYLYLTVEEVPKDFEGVIESPSTSKFQPELRRVS